MASFKVVTPLLKEFTLDQLMEKYINEGFADLREDAKSINEANTKYLNENIKTPRSINNTKWLFLTPKRKIHWSQTTQVNYLYSSPIPISTGKYAIYVSGMSNLDGYYIEYNRSRLTIVSFFQSQTGYMKDFDGRQDKFYNYRIVHRQSFKITPTGIELDKKRFMLHYKSALYRQSYYDAKLSRYEHKEICNDVKITADDLHFDSVAPHYVHRVAMDFLGYKGPNHLGCLKAFQHFVPAYIKNYFIEPVTKILSNIYDDINQNKYNGHIDTMFIDEDEKFLESLLERNQLLRDLFFSLDDIKKVLVRDSTHFREVFDYGVSRVYGVSQTTDRLPYISLYGRLSIDQFNNISFEDTLYKHYKSYFFKPPKEIDKWALGQALNIVRSYYHDIILTGKQKKIISYKLLIRIYTICLTYKKLYTHDLKNAVVNLSNRSIQINNYNPRNYRNILDFESFDDQSVDSLIRIYNLFVELLELNLDGKLSTSNIRRIYDNIFPATEEHKVAVSTSHYVGDTLRAIGILKKDYKEEFDGISWKEMKSLRLLHDNLSQLLTSIKERPVQNTNSSYDGLRKFIEDNPVVLDHYQIVLPESSTDMTIWGESQKHCIGGSHKHNLNDEAYIYLGIKNVKTDTWLGHLQAIRGRGLSPQLWTVQQFYGYRNNHIDEPIRSKMVKLVVEAINYAPVETISLGELIEQANEKKGIVAPTLALV